VSRKRTSRLLILGTFLALIALFSGPAYAQNYSFAVPELLMDVIVQSDGSTKIIYDITFENYGSTIDIVDIGTPHAGYSINNMSASIDGVALTDIRKSEYVDPGVEVHLKGQSIASGSTGTLHFEFTMPDMVYADTTNKENASLQITPTWFDSSSVRGTGNIGIRVILPEGIQLDEVLYQDVEFSDKGIENGRVVAVWRFENVAATQAYRVGVSFPRRVITNVIETTTWDLFLGWLAASVGVIGAVVSICFPIALPAFIFWMIFRAIKRAGKPNYLPPIAQVEGGGIKRGLTAPEAAVILELPLNKILALVIFGMLEKGLIRQVSADPLKVEVVEDFRVADKPHLDTPKTRRQQRTDVAQRLGTVVHKYEDAFLDLIEGSPDKPIKELKVVTAMDGLVKGAADKMQGFDLSDTQDYYRRVIERAMQQAAALGEIEQREQYLDKHLPWVMMDKGYGTVLTTGPYNYWPRWARSTRPVVAAGSGASVLTGAKPASGGRPAPKFGDVAASFSGWAETTMGGMEAAIMPTSLRKPTPASTSSSSSGSFHSSCACACAGCACACACAGGGR
jgi:hypothetical protein